MTVEELKQALNDPARSIALRELLLTLEPRKQEELEFHDSDREVDSAGHPVTSGKGVEASNKRFYDTNRKSTGYVSSWLERETKGKIFLDYGCGNGSVAVTAAKSGAALAIGIDISSVSIENAKVLAEAEGVGDRCIFLQADCEQTLIPDDCIDVVLCSGMLHHVDLSKAFPELRRIMRSGGKALAVEALAYNPLIQLYRRRTPQLRTVWEAQHILSMADVRYARRFFEVRERRHWHLFSIAAALTPRKSALQSVTLAIGDALDTVVLRVPLIRLWSWQFTFEMHKK